MDGECEEPSGGGSNNAPFIRRRGVGIRGERAERVEVSP